MSHVPTTLLGQVDAPSGARLAPPRARTWSAPSGNLGRSDTEVLAGLPPREYVRPGEMAVPLPTGVDSGRPAPDERVAECASGRPGRAGHHRAGRPGAPQQPHGPRPRSPASTTVTARLAIGLACRLPGPPERIDDERVTSTPRDRGHGLPTTIDGGLDPGALVDLSGGQEGVRRLTFVLDGPRGPSWSPGRGSRQETP